VRWLCSLLLLVAISVSAETRDIGFAWDPGSGYPSGTTYTLEANGASATGITGTTQTLSVPLDVGRIVNARVRAVAPTGSICGTPPTPCGDSPWAAIAQVYPAIQPAPDRAAWAVTSSGGGVMAAPTNIFNGQTTYNSGGNTSKTINVTVQTGDVLIVAAQAENFDADTSVSITVSGGGLTWTSAQTVAVNSYGYVRLYYATATSNATFDITLTATGTVYSGYTVYWGGSVKIFRGSDGVGASSKTNVSSGAPTLNITTTQANSAICVFNNDWNAVDGASRTWRTGAGSLTETTYFRDAARYSVYSGYHADAGSTGTKAVGLSAPSGQKYSIVAVEVKGSAGGGAIDLAGDAQTQATATGAVAMTVPTAGTAAAVATAAGSLAMALPVQTSASVTATASGDLLLEMALGGGALAAALAVGALGLTMPLSSSASGEATASGTLGLGAEIDLSGDAAGEASATGTLDSTTALAGAATAQAAGSGGVTLTTVLAGSALAEALATAGITLETALAAQAAAQASATGDVVSLAEGALAGDAAAQATATGDIKMATPLDGAAAAQASATGAVGMTVPLAGDAQAQATATGALDSLVDGSLAGDAAAKALATGAVDLSTFVAGPAQVVVTAGGMLGVSVPMAGSATVVVMATGNLQVSLGMPLSAAALAAASADGSLLLSIPLSGAALANAVAQGTLSGGVETFIPFPARTWAPGYIPRIWHPAPSNRTWVGVAGNRIWR
jgi:hypothetical protein